MCFLNLQSRKKRFRDASNIKKVDVDGTLRYKQVGDLSWVSLISSTTSKSLPPSFSLKPLRWYLSSFNFYFFNPAETASFVSWPISEGNGRHLGNVVNYSQLGLMSCAVQNREQGFLEIKNNDYEADSFFRLNFKVFIGVDNSERARARDKKCKEDQFRWRITWKFYSGCEKMRNASGHQSKNERQQKKSEQDHIQHFRHKTCNWEVFGSFTLSSCKTVVKKCTKKCATSEKFFFC